MVWTCLKKEQREKPKDSFELETKSKMKIDGHDLLPEVEMLKEGG
jgi:hypothetical protein